jgi:hypothetical protein
VSEAAAEAKRQSPEHLKRLQQWEQAWYCRKDAKVIVPEDGLVVSPTQFRDLMSGTA